MQALFDFEPSPLLPRLRDELLKTFGPQRAQARLDPTSQLIKSLISARTFDSVSAAAFAALRGRFPDWDGLKAADPAEVEKVIGAVTFADQKARQLPVLLRNIESRAGSLDLGLLGDWPVEDAMQWLQGLPGVGCHTAAATLNFSTLNKRTVVVDANVHRVTQRLGLSGRGCDAGQSHLALMALTPGDWNSEALFELHWLMKGLAQSICTDSAPACGRCPLKANCPRIDVGVGRKVIEFSGKRPLKARRY